MNNSLKNRFDLNQVIWEQAESKPALFALNRQLLSERAITNLLYLYEHITSTSFRWQKLV